MSHLWVAPLPPQTQPQPILSSPNQGQPQPNMYLAVPAPPQPAAKAPGLSKWARPLPLAFPVHMESPVPHDARLQLHTSPLYYLFFCSPALCLLGPNCSVGLSSQLTSLMTLPSDLRTPFMLLAPQEQPGHGQEAVSALLGWNVLYSFFFQDLRMDQSEVLSSDVPLHPKSLGQQLSLAMSASLCAGG